MNLRKIAVQLLIMLIFVTAIPAANSQQGNLRGPKNSTPRNSEPQTQSQSQSQSETYGPIVSSDTLWQISQNYRPNSSVSIYQVMQAIFELNPEAFEQQNINLLKDGSILSMPSESYILSVNSRQAQEKAELDSQNLQSNTSNQLTRQATDAATLDQTKELIEEKLGAIDEAQNRQFMAIRKQFAESIGSVQSILDENKKLFERLDKVNTDIDEMRSEEQQKSLQMNQMGESIEELLEKSRQDDAAKAAQMAEKNSSVFDNPITLIFLFTLPVLLALTAFAYWMIKRKKPVDFSPEEDEFVDLSLDPITAEMDDLSDALSAELSQESLDELDDDNLFGDDDVIDDVLEQELEESLDDVLEDNLEEPLVDDSEMFDELGDDALDDLLDEEFEEGSGIVEQGDLDSLFDEDDDLLAEIQQDISAEFSGDLADDLLAEVQGSGDKSDPDNTSIKEDEQQVNADLVDMDNKDDDSSLTPSSSDDETTIEPVADDDEQPEISIDELLDISADEVIKNPLTDDSEDIDENILQDLDKEIASQNQELDSFTGSLIDELEQVEQMQSMLPEDDEKLSEGGEAQLDIQKLDDLVEEINDDLQADDFGEKDIDDVNEIDISEVLKGTEQPVEIEELVEQEQEVEAETLVEPEPVIEAEELAEPVIEAEELVEQEPVVEAEELVEPEQIVDAEELVEPEPVVEAEELVESEPVVEAEELVEPEPVVEAEELVEPEPVVEVEELVEPEPVVEAEELVESESLVEVEELVEPEPVVEVEELVEPEPVVEAEELVESESLVKVEELVEPEPVVEAEELVEPEPVVEAEELVEPEPVVEAEELVEPEPVVEAEELVELEPVVEAEELVEPEPVVEAEELVESEPVIEAEELVEPEPVVEAEELVESESLVEVEELVEPEPVVEAEELVEPEPFVEAEELVEPEPVVEAEELVEPEPVVEAEELVEPEPVVEAEELVESEPVVDAEELVEPEPVVEAEELVEPEPVVEAEELVEPEPVVDAEELVEPEPVVEAEELVEPENVDHSIDEEHELDSELRSVSEFELPGSSDSILDEDQLEKALEDFEKEELDEVLEDLTSNETTPISLLDDLEFSADNFVTKEPKVESFSTVDDIASIDDFDDSELDEAFDETIDGSSFASSQNSSDGLDDLPGLEDWLDEDEIKPDAKQTSPSHYTDIIEQLDESSFDEMLQSLDLDDDSSEEDDDAEFDIAALLDETPQSEEIDINRQDTEDFLDVEALLNESVGAESDDDIDKVLDLDIPLEPFVNAQDNINMIDVDADDGLGAKLDLAHAYIEIGEEESAKELLDEILQKGSEEQFAQAKAILSEMG